MSSTLEAQTDIAGTDKPSSKSNKGTQQTEDSLEKRQPPVPGSIPRIMEEPSAWIKYQPLSGCR
eukprot:88004-Amphidinium_carterae.2